MVKNHCLFYSHPIPSIYFTQVDLYPSVALSMCKIQGEYYFPHLSPHFPPDFINFRFSSNFSSFLQTFLSPTFPKYIVPMCTWYPSVRGERGGVLKTFQIPYKKNHHSPRNQSPIVPSIHVYLVSECTRGGGRHSGKNLQSC